MTNDTPPTVTVGVISDTHGAVHPAVFDAFRDVTHILHAGDVGSEAVLSALQTIAPVTAVRGNTDIDLWAKRLPTTDVIEVGQELVYVLHNLAELDIVPETAALSVVVYGHTHKADVERRGTVLFVNPGSTRSFPPSVALLTFNHARPEARIVRL